MGMTNLRLEADFRNFLGSLKCLYYYANMYNNICKENSLSGQRTKLFALKINLTLAYSFSLLYFVKFVKDMIVILGEAYFIDFFVFARLSL